MISNQEFYQKLQTGQINEALTQVLFQANQLDITTHLSDNTTGDGLSADPSGRASVPSKSEYLRTKINLLTGKIDNEIGRDLVAGSSSYLQLQQLHIDQIIANHRVIQGHLQQLQQILAASHSDRSADMVDSFPRANRSVLATALPTRLTETFRAILTSSFSNNTQHPILPTEPISEDLSLPPIAGSSPKPIAAPVAFDDELDLSIDENAVEWEEWIHSENPASVANPIPPAPTKISQPTPVPLSIEVKIPEWCEDSAELLPQPIAVKPTGARATVTARAVDPVEQWDKFAPEHIGIYIETTPTPFNNNDPHQVDRLLADLDKIRQR